MLHFFLKIVIPEYHGFQILLNITVFKYYCIIEFVYAYQVNISLAKTGTILKQPSNLYASDNCVY